MQIEFNDIRIFVTGCTRGISRGICEAIRLSPVFFESGCAAS